MASEAKDKDKAKKPKQEGAGAKADGKAKAAKAAKADAKAAKADASPAKVEKPVEPPRPPADPRLKIVKKFQKRFLPRGPLRDREKALMDRWNSGDDHGGVTLEELKSLLSDWRADQARRKPQPVRS